MRKSKSGLICGHHEAWDRITVTNYISMKPSMDWIRPWRTRLSLSFYGWQLGIQHFMTVNFDPVSVTVWLNCYFFRNYTFAKIDLQLSFFSLNHRWKTYFGHQSRPTSVAGRSTLSFSDRGYAIFMALKSNLGLKDFIPFIHLLLHLVYGDLYIFLCNSSETQISAS